MALSTEAAYNQEVRRRVHYEADIVIVGAGIVGCAIAVAFGRQGRSVLLLERSLKEPERIIGELLQPGGVAALEKLGMKDCLEEIDAIRVKGYEVIYYGQGVHIPYPHYARGADRTKNNESKPEGRSFHHGRFIQKLREAARRTPNVTVVETTVTDLVSGGHSGQILGVKCLTDGKKDCVSPPLKNAFVWFNAHLTFYRWNSILDTSPSLQMAMPQSFENNTST
jgi:squalene monooxygenase